jgi:hypothetical protein
LHAGQNTCLIISELKGFASQILGLLFHGDKPLLDLKTRINTVGSVCETEGKKGEIQIETVLTEKKS